MLFVVAFLFVASSSSNRKKKSKVYKSDSKFMALVKGFMSGIYELIHGSPEVQKFFQNIVLCDFKTSTKPAWIEK